MRSALQASGCARAPCLLRGAVDWSSCGKLGRGYKEVKQLMRKGVARSSFWAFKGKPREGAAFSHLLQREYGFQEEVR